MMADRVEIEEAISFIPDKMILWILDLGAEDREGQLWTGDGDLRDIRLRQALIHSFPNGGHLEAIPYSSFSEYHHQYIESPPQIIKGVDRRYF